MAVSIYHWTAQTESALAKPKPIADAELTPLAQQRPLSELEQQGLIQAFEFTHELAWNTLKDFLQERGAASLFGSKDATRQAFAVGLIENGEIWMAMIRSRNRTTHAYDQATANEIARAITTSYLAEFGKFQKRFAELEQTQT